ncbi:MAG: AraC family transcriptional regulator, partial [Sneathiella sp.]
MQYVTNWRIEIAKKLLTNPANTLTDAAEGAGYASDSAFSRVFKKETGMTPAWFRKESSANRPDL